MPFQSFLNAFEDETFEERYLCLVCGFLPKATRACVNRRRQSAATAEDAFLGCAAYGQHVVPHAVTVAIGCVKRGMRHMRRASLSGALRVMFAGSACA